MSSPIVLPIVDTHLHFIDPSRFHYPWLDGAGVEPAGGRASRGCRRTGCRSTSWCGGTSWQTPLFSGTALRTYRIS